MQSLLPYSTARIKSLPGWRPIALARDSAVLLSKRALHYQSYFILCLFGSAEAGISAAGFNYSLLTGVCVGAGTIAFFVLFQRGGPLSAVPAILAGGAAIMAIAGILFFHEAASWQRLLGVVLAIVGLFLLRK